MTNSEETSEATALITVNLDIGERAFQSIEEIQEWVKQERAFFAWMETGKKNDGNASHAWNATNQWLNFFNQYIQGYNQAQSTPASLKNHAKQLINELNHHIEKGLLISSKNPDAIFGKNLAGTESEVVACYAIANLLNIPSNQNHPIALKGAFYAFQYRQGSTATIESYAESLDSLCTEWNDLFNKQRIALKEQNKSLIEEIEDLRTQFSDLKNEIETQKNEQVEAFNSQLEKSASALSDIEQTYDKKLALQSSVQYWTDKRTSHTTVMRYVGVATIILATLTGIGFIWAAHEFLQMKTSEVELWRFGVLLAISTFGIWITRLSAKIFISNLHLRTDADERVTMIQTYLALLREGSGLKDEEKQLILQTLFRPSNTGFIKDDGPSSFHDLITNALSRK